MGGAQPDEPTPSAAGGAGAPPRAYTELQDVRKLESELESELVVLKTRRRHWEERGKAAAAKGGAIASVGHGANSHAVATLRAELAEVVAMHQQADAKLRWAPLRHLLRSPVSPALLPLPLLPPPFACSLIHKLPRSPRPPRRIPAAPSSSSGSACGRRTSRPSTGRANCSTRPRLRSRGGAWRRRAPLSSSSAGGACAPVRAPPATSRAISSPWAGPTWSLRLHQQPIPILVATPPAAHSVEPPTRGARVYNWCDQPAPTRPTFLAVGRSRELKEKLRAEQRDSHQKHLQLERALLEERIVKEELMETMPQDW